MMGVDSALLILPKTVSGLATLRTESEDGVVMMEPLGEDLERIGVRAFSKVEIGRSLLGHSSGFQKVSILRKIREALPILPTKRAAGVPLGSFSVEGRTAA